MIQVEWGSAAKTTLYWKFTNPWTWTEFYNAQKEGDSMLDTVEGAVDNIFFPEEQQTLPKGALTQFRLIFERRHQQSRLNIIVGSKTFLKMMLETLNRIEHGGIFLFAKDEADALRIIEEYSQSESNV